MVLELDLQLLVQSVSIIIKVVSSNPIHGEVYSIQHYVIKFVSDLRHFQQYFSYTVAVSFIGGGNWSARRKPPTCRKSLTNFIT